MGEHLTTVNMSGKDHCETARDHTPRDHVLPSSECEIRRTDLRAFNCFMDAEQTKIRINFIKFCSLNERLEIIPDIALEGKAR
jgi:hypothetical protein